MIDTMSVLPNPSRPATNAVRYGEYGLYFDTLRTVVY